MSNNDASISAIINFVKSRPMPALREEVKSITVRLPVSLYDQVKGEATISRRSVNQQIIFMLERFYPVPPSTTHNVTYGGVDTFGENTYDNTD